MDNTPIYIKISEKAKEIQDIKNIGKNPCIGDYVFLKGGNFLILSLVLMSFMMTELGK